MSTCRVINTAEAKGINESSRIELRAQNANNTSACADNITNASV
jgi:hypothetical protein